MTSAQALIHGDLHTGSIMLTTDDTRVIDPEFAFIGPIGFDVGAVIGNLLLAFFAQEGHEAAPGARDAYREWILAQTEPVWDGLLAIAFSTSGARRPRATPMSRASLCPRTTSAALEKERARFMRGSLRTRSAFAGREDDPPHSGSRACRGSRNHRRPGARARCEARRCGSRAS